MRLISLFCSRRIVSWNVEIGLFASTSPIIFQHALSPFAFESGFALRYQLRIIEIEFTRSSSHLHSGRWILSLSAGRGSESFTLRIEKLLALLEFFHLLLFESFLLCYGIGIDNAVDNGQSLFFRHGSKSKKAVLLVHDLGMTDQFIELGGKFGYALVVGIQSVQHTGCSGEARLSFQVLLPLHIDVAQTNLTEGKIGSSCRALLYSGSICFDRRQCIGNIHVYIACCIEDLIQYFFVLAFLGHPFQSSGYCTGIPFTLQLHLPDPCGKVQSERRRSPQHFGIGFASLLRPIVFL